MSRIAYVNGRYVPQYLAMVNVEDRGYQFADGVYEVIGVAGGKLVDAERHFDRLERSLAELRIPAPCRRGALSLIARQLLSRNSLKDGIVYLQVSRGEAPRSHAFPESTRPSLVMTASRTPPAPGAALLESGVRVVTIPDNRWKRVDIKTISLLPNILGKQIAVEQGAFEAWFVDDKQIVTEGTSTNAWIVTGSGGIVTHPLDHSVLAGITRRAVIEAAGEAGIPVSERPFKLSEAHAASEAFLTSTTTFVLPVTAIDGTDVGDGRPGPVTRTLIAGYDRHVRRLGEGG
jgi:D-alanine transaminase